MKPELLKLMSLNDERKHAYLTARDLRNGAYELFGLFVGLYGSNNIPRFLRLVADALDDKRSKFDLTPIGLDIVKAWWAAHGIAGRSPNGFDITALPTLLEVKTQYAVAQRRNPPADLVKKRKRLNRLEQSNRVFCRTEGSKRVKTGTRQGVAFARRCPVAAFQIRRKP